MRVLHIIKVVRVAGAEQHLLLLLSGLRGRGVDARILLLTEPGTPMDDFVALAAEQGIPLERLAMRRHLDVTLPANIRRHLRVFAPDVVHTHLLHADLYGIPLARLSGARAVVSSRHNDNAFRRRWVMRLLHRRLWRMTGAGIAISEAIRQFCIAVEGAPPDKMHTIRYGFDAPAPADPAALRAELGLSTGAPLVGMVCRLIEQKGVTYGLQAFARVAGDFPYARLIIAGDGVLRADLEAEAARLGIAERTHWLGWRDDGPTVLAALDVLLMPSLWEGFGLVMLEAMAVHVPIIASRVSAIPEVVVDGETGLLVAPRDVDGLAAALHRLLSDAALRRDMGAAGAARLTSQFSAAQMIDATLTLYRSLLE